MGYDGSLKFDTKVDESGFNSGITKLGSVAKSGLVAVGALVTGYVTAFSALTKSALDEVASLEQNVGGIETLFGAGGKSLEEYAESIGKSTDKAKENYEKLLEAQNLALENANNAYKTAGLSANEYMSTVTSFAASLKQSVSDEVEAANAANQAVIDMSDNANKMGTDMQLIQNAYQGFAKQNYTMLDNLKLGYGGTKEEMQRLLADAQKISGIKYDISNLNDVYSAIHVIQTELGITGTTAKEAASTIEGSMSSAKAAWSNFLAGTGSADQLVESVNTAAEVVVNNLSEIIPRLADTIPEAIVKLGPTVMKLGPVLFEAGKGVIADFAKGIMQIVPQLPEKAAQVTSTLLEGIQEKAPVMIESGAKMLADFVRGIGEQLPTLVPKALETVVVLADALISNIPTIVTAGISMIRGLITGVVNSLPTLISEGPRIINDFAEAIYSAIGNLISLGLEMIVSLVKGLWENRGLILENAGEIFLAILNVFSLSKLFSLGKGLLTNLGKGIKSFASHPVSTMKEVLQNAINAVKNMDWKNLGKNILTGIVEGIKKNAKNIVSALTSAAQGALNGVKKFLGIHSPSTVFRDEIGKNMALGVGEGFEYNIPVDQMADGISHSIQKMNRRVSDITQTTPAIIARKATESYASNNQTASDLPEDTVVQITNVFEVDGTKLVEKTTKATIKKISSDQVDKNKAKGK